jgi:hypothetical protein
MRVNAKTGITVDRSSHVGITQLSSNIKILEVLFFLVDQWSRGMSL